MESHSDFSRWRAVLFSSISRIFSRYRKDVIVVGMENAENFMQIRSQRWLFDALFPGKQLLFVCRYPQESLEHLRSSASPHSQSLRSFRRFRFWQEFISIFQSFMPIWVIGLPSWCHLISREKLAEGNAALYNQQYAQIPRTKMAVNGCPPSAAGQYD